MSDVYIYERGARDFTTLGLCGRLRDTECTCEMIANNMMELTLEHPIDREGRFALLTPGRVLKAQVPVRNIPELEDDSEEYVTVYEKWTVRSGATRTQRTVWNKRDDQVDAEQAAADAETERIREDMERRRAAGEDISDEMKNAAKRKKIEKKALVRLKRGRKVTVVKNYGDRYPEYRVRVGKVTGYMDKEALQDKVTERWSGSSKSIEKYFDEIAPSWTVKEQLFRIYEVRRDGDSVVASARALFFDNAFTLTNYEKYTSQKLATVLRGIKSARIGTCTTVFHTNIKGVRSGQHYQDKSIAEAILDPDDGLLVRYGADLILDNYDAYLIGQAGYDRGVTLEYGYDLTGVEYTVNWDSVVTHIRPVGETADGRALYIKGHKGLVTTDAADEYDFMNVMSLPVPDAKVKKGAMTTAEARARLKEAAREEMAKGIDQPDVSLSVTFSLLGDTQRYAKYRDMKKLFLFDTVRVRHPKLRVDARAVVRRVVWDCHRDRMREMELGTVRDIGHVTPSWGLSYGISGGKLAGESVTGAALVSDAIETRHIQAESITADLIAAEAITSDKILAGQVTADKLAAGAVDAQAIAAITAAFRNLTAQDVHAGTLDAGTLAASFAHIIRLAADDVSAGTVVADTLTAALMDAQVLTAGSADFGIETVKHLIGSVLQVSDLLESRLARIDNLYVTQANLANATLDRLTVLGTDGEYYDIAVGSDGLLLASVRDVSAAEIAAGETADGRGILPTAYDMETLADRYIDDPDSGIKTLYVEAISAGKITAQEAFIGSAEIPDLEATVIRAINDRLMLYADEAVRLFIGRAEDYNSTFDFSAAGLRTRIGDSLWSTLVTNDGYYIDHAETAGHVGAFRRGTFEPRSIKMGRTICRPTSAGGWSWSVDETEG